MYTFYHPFGNDQRIISGESGAAGLGALLALLDNDSFSYVREKLNLNKKTAVLLINTEGDTDPDSFKRLAVGDI